MALISIFQTYGLAAAFIVWFIPIMAGLYISHLVGNKWVKAVIYFILLILLGIINKTLTSPGAFIDAGNWASYLGLLWAVVFIAFIWNLFTAFGGQEKIAESGWAKGIGGDAGEWLRGDDGKKKPKTEEEKAESTEENLFDIILDLIKSKIFVDEDLNVKITLVNFGVPGKVNVSLYYEILDLENNVILIENETISVETQIEFIKTFKLPPTVKLGDYKLSVKLIFGDRQEAISQSSFQIVSKEKQWPALIIFTILVAFGLYILITILRKRLKKKNQK